MPKPRGKAAEQALEAAAMHLAAGAIDKRKAEDVPVGRHDLSGLRVVVSFPDGAAVERDSGELGNGYNVYTATSKGLSLAAVLLFIERSGASGPDAVALWVECIREAIEGGTKAEDHMPPEASQALAKVQAKLQEDCQAQRKTPAKRIGVDLVTVEIEAIGKRKRAA